MKLGQPLKKTSKIVQGTPSQQSSALFTTINAARRQQAAWDIWRMFCERTLRPVGDKDYDVDGVIDKLAKALTKHNSVEPHVLDNLVYLASLLDPMGDVEDTKRLIYLFRYQKTRNEAYKRQSDGGTTIFWFHGNNQTAEERVRKFLGYPYIDDFSKKDREYIFKLNNLSDAALAACAEKAKRIRRASWVLPDEAVKYGMEKSTKKALRKAREKYDPYAAGKTETDSYVSEDYLGYDLMAQQMIIDGVPQEDVLSFHHLAPEGYWAAVKATLDELGKRSKHAPEVYTMLEKDFGGFNPNNRQTGSHYA